MTTRHTHGHAKEGPQMDPFLSIANIDTLLERFKLPDIDWFALMEAQKKNVQALQKANQKALDGALALAKRQTEIFGDTLQQWQDAAKELSAKGSSDDIGAKQAAMAKKALENALDNMRELAEMAVESQAEAYEIIRKRIRSGIEEFGQYVQRRS